MTDTAPILRFNNEQSAEVFDASERVLCQDILGITRHSSSSSSSGGGGTGSNDAKKMAALPIPERLDRLHRRLGFAPLPFVCLIWNFLSTMIPQWAVSKWVAVYCTIAAGLLLLKVG